MTSETQGESGQGDEPSQLNRESSNDETDGLRTREGSARADDKGRKRTDGSKDPISAAIGKVRRQAKSDLRKARGITWKWSTGIISVFVIAVVTAAAGHITDGWFSASPSLSPTMTQVRLMQPFSADGKLLPPYQASSTLTGGTCINSYESSDPDALRCFSNGQVADPCWSSIGRVACLGSTWDTRALIIIGPKITAKFEAAIGPIPWGVEIIDPADTGQILQCGFAGGAVGLVAGMRKNWDCFKQGQFNPKGFTGYALGAPQISNSKPWMIYYAGANDSQVVEATVIIVWR